MNELNQEPLFVVHVEADGKKGKGKKGEEQDSGILEALFAFQNEEIQIVKNTEGYGYKYASLDTILSQIKVHLKKHNLLYIQPIAGTKLITRIYHVTTGQYIESSVDINSLQGGGKMNNVQALGAAITYMRRYSLVSVLGLVTEEDLDGKMPDDSKQDNKKQNGPDTNVSTKPDYKKPIPPQNPKNTEVTIEQFKKQVEGAKDLKGLNDLWKKNPKFQKIQIIKDTFATRKDALSPKKDDVKEETKRVNDEPLTPQQMRVKKEIEDSKTIEELEDIFEKEDILHSPLLDTYYHKHDLLDIK